MKNFLLYILDSIFPPSNEVLRLRALSPEGLCSSLPPAPPSPFAFITSLFAYKDPLVAEFIWCIKYKKDKHSLRCAGFALLAGLKDKNVLLIPIPTSKKRRRERGFNQCELLIDEMCKLDPRIEKRFDILQRTKDGGEQKLKDRVGRLENKNIFSVTSIESSKPIIIIDDVTTTGSTLKEARDALLKAGYRDVSALTLAH